MAATMTSQLRGSSNPKHIDYTGQKYNMLTFKEYSHSDGKSAWWWVECDCGNVKRMRSQEVRNPANISCGCYRKKIGHKHNAWRGCGKLGSSIVKRIKSQAKRRDIFVGEGLTIEYLWNLFVKQNEKCALTGIDLTLPKDYRPGWVKKHNLSLDRIDSSVGYILGNVQWVCKDVNFMKQQLSEEHFVEMCRLVVQTQDEKALDLKCAEYF